MPPEVLLTVALVLGFLIAAGAVMAIVASALVVYFRARENKRGAGAGSEQSPVIANGVFELDGDGGLFHDEGDLLDGDGGLHDDGLFHDEGGPLHDDLADRRRG